MYKMLTFFPWKKKPIYLIPVSFLLPPVTCSFSCALFKLFYCRFEIFPFSFVRVPDFFPRFGRREKKHVSENVVPPLSIDFLHTSLITLDSKNRLLLPFPTFFDATDIGFAFPTHFNARLNIPLSTNHSCPMATFVPNMCVSYIEIRYHRLSE